MNNRKAASICCFTLGTVLLLSALFLVAGNLYEDRKGGETADSVLRELKATIPECTEPAIVTGEQYDLYARYETVTEAAAQQMDSIELDGKIYIGYLTIPEIALELPVQSSWSYPQLKESPCRYAGSVGNGDIVIAAHNYTSHFGKIKNLHTDSEIIFTDVSGNRNRYLVKNTEELPGTAVDQMKFGNADDWDLTLFTCTLSGQSRVTVRAVRE